MCRYTTIGMASSVDQRCREGIGHDARNLERHDNRSLDAHSQRGHAQKQDLHSSLLTQVARHLPDDGIDEQEEPFHQEVADERVVPGSPGLLLWRSSKAKRAECDTNEEYQRRYGGIRREQTDRASAENSHAIPRRDLSKFGCVIARRKGISEQPKIVFPRVIRFSWQAETVGIGKMDMDPLKLTISPYRVYDRIQAISDDTIDSLYPSIYQLLYKDITDRLTHVSLLLSFYPAHAQGFIIMRAADCQQAPAFTRLIAPATTGCKAFSLPSMTTARHASVMSSVMNGM